ncbi:MAG: membrane protein insertase YidC [Pyrinomonadaceae bacterium]|nr:MAG: membrane protein insertase YidC [Pyrinomonadaceae bacterium]
MENRQKENQARILLATALSMLVIGLWSYFFAPEPPKEKPKETTTQQADVAEKPSESLSEQTTIKPVNTAPNRTITIKTPLYEAKFDSKGALATSWVLIKNVHDQHEKLLFANGSDGTSGNPLQLISQKALETRQLPFRLVSNRADLEAFLNESTYEVLTDSENIELKGSESKQIDFRLVSPEGFEITKSFIFRADSYVTDFTIKATQNGQSLRDLKLLVGAEFGDQAIIHHNYYHIEPEAIALVNNATERYGGYYFNYDSENKAVKKFNGKIDWTAVGDTYFAIAAVPSKPASETEFHSLRYEVNVEPFYSGIFAWITRSQTTKLTRHFVSAYLPVADGDNIKVYVGSKDYFTLAQYNQKLSQQVGREINLDNLINWGWTGTITKPIAILLLRILNFIFAYVGNYGVAIVIFTIIFYSVLFPIRLHQTKAFKKAQVNAPKMKEIQDKIRDLQKKGVPLDDPRMRQLQLEQLKLMKGAVPLGGCLPLLLQIPLFIALYVAVTVSLDFRQAHFLWLPDLSAADPLHALEFLFAGSMLISMLFTPTAPAMTPEQAMQQKMMTYLMPLMMLWLLWGAPSGLLLYWFFGNIVSFGQQLVINQMLKDFQPVETTSTAVAGSRKNLQTP